jgi:hypothetical protein
MNNVSPGTATPAVTPPLRNPMKAFRTHLSVYLVVVGLLAALNFYLGEPYWVLYVLAGWGIGIAGHGVGAFMKKRGQET